MRGIKGSSETMRRASLAHWDSLAKPLGSLGTLEQAVTDIAALTGSDQVHLCRARLLLFCADNGVVAQGISQSDSSVTLAVAQALGAGTSTVSYMAAHEGCHVLPVNIGMADETPAGVRDMAIRRSTGDISLGPAMSREECERAILAGADLVREAKEEGYEIVLLGEMGIGNTTTSAAVGAVLTGQPPAVMTGRGAGLSDAGLNRKISVITQAIALNRPDPSDPVDLLQKVGGLDLAALCGACLGGAYYGIPILLDGVITCAAALCAVRMHPVCREALIASHCSAEPAARLLLEQLGLRPFIQADLHLGEGSGAMLALGLLRQVLAVYNSGHTFDHLGIEAYVPQ